MIVRLRREVVDAAIVPVKVRNYGKIERPVRIRDEGDLRVYSLGRIASQERDGLVPWSRILVGVEAPASSASRGSAGWTMLLRAWLAIFRVF